MLATIPLVLATSACKTPETVCPLPESSSLIIRSSRRLNVDEQGRSLPTIVRVYQLKDLGRLENATFEAVWRDPEGTLADSVVASDEVVMYPGRVETRTFERNPEAYYIVGIAIVRRPAGVSWRTVLELPPPRAALACALAQEEEEEAGPPPIPQVTLDLEDYHIEGVLRLIPPASQCAAGDLRCSMTPPDIEEPAAPEAPAAPSAPSAPSVPTP